MNRQLTGTLICLLLSLPVQAADRMTEEQIRQVIRATDLAAMNRDTLAIGMYLADSFEKVIEFVYKQKWLAKVRLDKAEYMELIDKGWANVEAYDYQRNDTVIHLKPDGLSGESHSTITENFVQDGVEITSRFRESSTYTMDKGWPVITNISGHTLVGDTTPQWQEKSSGAEQTESQ
ncbi:MAG: hypothetical protein OEU91_11470 [Gammaproteobacteria bacterium]|nr:hypothetical protein [Gammaproteobacteria bacterium]